MNYRDFKSWVVAAIENASLERRLSFAKDTVSRLLDTPAFMVVRPENELAPDAWTAFVAARRDVFSASPARLKELLFVVDNGVLTDGNMDGHLLNMLVAIDCWAGFLEDGNVSSVVILADTWIAHIDWLIDGAKLDDFLASTEMQRERDRIAALLIDPEKPWPAPKGEAF